MGNIQLLFSDTKEFIATEINKASCLMVLMALLVIVGLFLLHLEISHMSKLLGT
jgi:hypothetical protein